MSTSDVIRAWKDEAYRLSLSEEERALLLPTSVSYFRPTSIIGVICVKEAQDIRILGAMGRLVLV